jgi:AraC-like DNA-binding protein
MSTCAANLDISDRLMKLGDRYSASGELCVLGQATDAYADRSVLPALQEHFARTWVHSPSVEVSVNSVIVPDGYVDLIWFNGVLVVAGPDRQAKVELVPPGAVVVGLQFRPGVATNWLKISVSEIVDARAQLEDFWGPEALHIAQWMGEAAEPQGIARRLEAAVLRRLPCVDGPGRLARALFQEIDQEHHSSVPLIHRLKGSLGVSERALRRLSSEAFGYGPKTLDRILRFQRFMHLARGTRSGSLAELALGAGYADQPHLTRETRELSGFTPDAIRTQLKA